MSNGCLVCSEEVQENSKRVRCSQCGRSAHLYCAREERNVGESSVDRSIWTCRQCEKQENRLHGLPQNAHNTASFQLPPAHGIGTNPQNPPLTVQHFDLIMGELKGLAGAVKTCTEGVAKIEVTLKTCVSDVSKLVEENNLLKKRVTDLEQKLDGATSVNAIHAELADRRSREESIIVFNLPEKNDERADLGAVNDIVQSIIQTNQEVAIVDIKRLGRIAQKDSQPRPLKVRLRTREEALLVLRGKHKLKQGDNNAVRIKADLTPSQQQYLASLRREIETRENAGETNLTIRHVNGQPTIVSLRKKKRGRSEERSPGQVGLRDNKRSHPPSTSK